MTNYSHSKVLRENHDLEFWNNITKVKKGFYISSQLLTLIKFQKV